MSEEKAEYVGETPENLTYEIRDEAAPRGFYSQIPNIVDEMGLTPYAYRLYSHLRRRAGETGQCWENTENLAKACGMSAGKISEAKRELENVYPPLIRVSSKKKADGRIYHSITITDIWQINQDYFEKKPVHVVKGEARSRGETYRSRGERKNNPLNQEKPLRDETKKQGDLVDAALMFMPGIKHEQRKQFIRTLFQEKLVRPYGKDGNDLIDLAAAQLRDKGHDPNKFIQWWKKNNPNPQYWTLSKMIQQYDLSFQVASPEIETPVPSVMTEDTTKYVPPPAHLRAQAHAKLHANRT